MSQHRHNFYNELAEGLGQFEAWALSADRHEDGWESDFPRWDALISSAEHLMLDVALDEHGLKLVERCWEISEETEQCAEFARHNLDQNAVRELLIRLTHANASVVRWQAYDVIGYIQQPFEKELLTVETGLKDKNAYVRQRAFLALLRLCDKDFIKYIPQMLNDEDSYVRFVAVKITLNLSDKEIREQAEEILDRDAAVNGFFRSYIENKQLIDQLENNLGVTQQ